MVNAAKPAFPAKVLCLAAIEHATHVGGEDEDGVSFGIGDEYDFRKGIVASLRINRDSYDGDVVSQYTLGVSYRFRKGGTFGHRDFVSVLPGY